MQTMQEHPGRCRGCLVVAPTEGSGKFPKLSPNTAAVANASKPEGGSHSTPALLLSAILRLLKSGSKEINL